MNPVDTRFGDAANGRVLVAGDVHGNTKWVRTLAKLAARHRCSGIIQLGDFGLWPTRHDRDVLDTRFLEHVATVLDQFGVWMRFIDGNHDAHPLARSAFPAAANGVRSIEPGVLDWADRGAVWEWCGTRFGALGGAESVDRVFRTEGLNWWPTERVSDADVEWLTMNAGPAGVDVLCTQDSPVLPPGIGQLRDPVLEALCANSVARVSEAVDAVTPDLVLHGHYHLRWSGQHPSGARVEGFASDVEAARSATSSWAVLNIGDGTARLA